MNIKRKLPVARFLVSFEVTGNVKSLHEQLNYNTKQKACCYMPHTVEAHRMTAIFFRAWKWKQTFLVFAELNC